MSDDADQFTITSATGVDVQVAIAGPGSRSYAFIIDWHIRLLLAFAWFALAALLMLGHIVPKPGDATTGAAYLLGATLPPFAIFFLYHPVLEIVMRGRTPGKRIAGVRVVTASGGVPSAGALLVRNLFRIIDMLPAFYLVGLVSTIVTANKVRIGDLASGTVLAFDRSAELDALAELGARASRSRLPPAALEVIGDLLERWQALDSVHRVDMAETLLRRFGTDGDKVSLGRSDEADLRSRLAALLNGEASA